jgi:hypothetical protein
LPTEVRFKNNGLDAIEVQDNGSGIVPDDYETIALKHYTSKLSTYDDLSLLQTFGFRGEALSSLCALSKFHIITARASDGPKGAKLEFEQSGRLKGTSVVAAKQGTTVVVETLFHNLPVRRKELEKNAKREYSKVLELLQAYACISTGVKFNISNHVAKGYVLYPNPLRQLTYSQKEDCGLFNQCESEHQGESRKCLWCKSAPRAHPAQPAVRDGPLKSSGCDSECAQLEYRRRRIPRCKDSRSHLAACSGRGSWTPRPADVLRQLAPVSSTASQESFQRGI